MDGARRDTTHLLARATGALVLVAGFVYVITHWSALSSAPAIEGRRTLERRVRLLEDGEKASAEELAAQSDRLGRLESAWERSEETDPDGEAYDG